jgi:hypothetical protein
LWILFQQTVEGHIWLESLWELICFSVWAISLSVAPWSLEVCAVVTYLWWVRDSPKRKACSCTVVPQLSQHKTAFVTKYSLSNTMNTQVSAVKEIDHLWAWPNWEIKYGSLFWMAWFVQKKIRPKIEQTSFKHICPL